MASGSDIVRSCILLAIVIGALRRRLRVCRRNNIVSSLNKEVYHSISMEKLNAKINNRVHDCDRDIKMQANNTVALCSKISISKRTFECRTFCVMQSKKCDVYQGSTSSGETSGSFIIIAMPECVTCTLNYLDVTSRKKLMVRSKIDNFNCQFRCDFTSVNLLVDHMIIIYTIKVMDQCNNLVNISEKIQYSILFSQDEHSSVSIIVYHTKNQLKNDLNQRPLNQYL